MQCSNCHAEVVEESAFCHKCGARLTKADSAAPPAAPAGGTAGAWEQLAPRGTGANLPEEEVWHGAYSSRATIPHAVGHAVLALIALIVTAVINPSQHWIWWIVVLSVLVICLAPWVRLFYKRLSATYRLTTQRLFHESGMMHRVMRRLDVIDIEDVSCEQGVIDRMLGVGTVRVTSTDRDEPVLAMVGIDDARNVVDKIDRIRRAERMRRGLHIETS